MTSFSSNDAERPSAARDGGTWRMIRHVLTRPQPGTFSVPLVVLMLIPPFYIFIADYFLTGRTLHAPELALDRMIPMQPIWSLVYGSLVLAAFLPLLVVHQPEHIRRTVFAYITVWLVAYVCFLAYPTVAPRPANVRGGGFSPWLLRIIYAADPPRNCFPCLHVAQPFLAALTCERVHRGVGVVALIWAFLVGVSALYTKQHYVLDVIAGIALAAVAYGLFLRTYPREAVPEIDRRIAPALAWCAAGIYGLIVAGFWVAYLVQSAN